jgi:hypothetical protein
MDDDDMRPALKYGDRLPEIADFLCRPQPEVRARCKELGLTISRMQGRAARRKP